MEQYTEIDTDRNRSTIKKKSLGLIKTTVLTYSVLCFLKQLKIIKGMKCNCTEIKLKNPISVLSPFNPLNSVSSLPCVSPVIISFIHPKERVV